MDSKSNGKQSMFWYRITKLAGGFVSRFIFGRKYIRNEIKGVKGPLVIIANHQASLDFVNLMGATKRPMTFVVSSSFYNTVPVKGIMKKIGVIPKQQFQTQLADLKKMKEAIKQGKILVIYPAGLMCEDGLSTPIPVGTYKFLKWIGADIYMAKTEGSYFSMPKWSKGMRKGKTYVDIYKLFSKEELKDMELSEVKEIAERALTFDAYREQENRLVKFKKNDNIEGLENVLYMCPHCKSEFTVRVKDKSTVYCESCGYSQTSDKYGFLHKNGDTGEEIRYVSDWSRLIYSELKDKIEKDGAIPLECDTEIHKINYEKKRYEKTGDGHIALCGNKFVLTGTVHGEEINLDVPIGTFASVPFKPGRHIELQFGDEIFRCVLSDGKLAMKFVNIVKIHYELNSLAQTK